jgi:hypothetical protein
MVRLVAPAVVARRQQADADREIEEKAQEREERDQVEEVVQSRPVAVR